MRRHPSETSAAATARIATFALVIVALAVMPHGLFGQAQVKKV